MGISQVANVDFGIWGMQATLTDFLSKTKQYEEINVKSCPEVLEDRMLMLSLQKFEDNQMVALLYHNGNVHRFDPLDSLNVLELLFETGFEDENRQVMRELAIKENVHLRMVDADLQKLKPSK